MKILEETLKGISEFDDIDVKIALMKRDMVDRFWIPAPMISPFYDGKREESHEDV